MKRAITILMTLVMLFTFAGTAMAAETYDTPDALYNEWESNGYPDDVGNVYYDDATGHLAINLVGGSAAREQEILAMIKDPAGLSFGESKYSYNEMRAVQREIEAEMAQKDSKIYSVVTGWGFRNNAVVGFGDSGKEFRIIVSVDESVLDKYTKAYADQYGDMVYVEKGAEMMAWGGIGVENTPGIADTSAQNPALIYAVGGALIVAVFMMLLFVIRHRRAAPAMQTAQGTTVAASHPLGKQETVALVKVSELAPSDVVHDKLMEQIKD